MLSLGCDRRNMPLTGSRFLLRSRTRRDPACAAVVTDTVHGYVVDGGVVNVMNVGDIYVIHRAVVIELAMVPAATLVTSAKVAKTVIDAAIKSDCWPPVARVENEPDTIPAPIGRRPKESHLRGGHPRAWHPVVISEAGIPGPVTRCPDPAWSWTRRLHINRQGRRTKIDCDANRDLREDLTDEVVKFFPVYSYLVVYRPETKPLQIVSILHGHRDVPAILKDRL